MREDSDELSDFRGHKRENFVPNLENQSGLGQGCGGNRRENGIWAVFSPAPVPPPPCGASARHGKIKKKLKAGTAIFLLGDADDSPGLSFIGFTLAVLLIMRGIAYTGRIRQGFCG